MIDLHTHTTASDGRCSPADLVARAVRAGVQVLALTDHDTTAGCAAAAAACRHAGVTFVPGIEITAVLDGDDVHMLGYFIDTDSTDLAAFLAEQRMRRIGRVRRMVARLADAGIVLDADAIVRPAEEDMTRSAGRPWIARALLSDGHVTSTKEAFDLWLGSGRPAFVPRDGASPAEVVARIHGAGGLASLAHPVLVGRDALVGELAGAGLDALEVYHWKHDAAATMRYLGLARAHRLLVTGGSDFHGDEAHGPQHPGAVALPEHAWAAFAAAGAGRARS